MLDIFVLLLVLVDGLLFVTVSLWESLIIDFHHAVGVG